MPPTIILIAAFIVLAAGAAIAKHLGLLDPEGQQRTKRTEAPSNDPKTSESGTPATPQEKFHDYEMRPTLLTDPEKVLYGRLLSALPDHTVAVQVQVSQVVRPALTDQRQAALNRINRKSIDFVVLDRSTRPVLAIELDDATHKRPDRQKADKVKTAALESAGLMLARYPVSEIPTAETLAADVAYAARRASAQQ